MSLAKPQGKGLFPLTLEHEAQTCAGVSETLQSKPLGGLHTQRVKTQAHRGARGRARSELAWQRDALTDQGALRAAPPAPGSCLSCLREAVPLCSRRFSSLRKLRMVQKA